MNKRGGEDFPKRALGSPRSLVSRLRVPQWLWTGVRGLRAQGVASRWKEANPRSLREVSRRPSLLRDSKKER